MPSSLVLSDSVLDFEAKRKLKKDKKKMMKNNNDDSIMETEKKKKESKKKKRLVEEVIEDENLIVSSKKPKKQKISEITEDEVVKKKSKKNDSNAVSNFRISEPLKEKLRSKGIETLFPIQAMTFNTVLDGFDLVGRAHTGQGKTLAFVLPILESLTNGLAKTSRKTGYGRAPTVLVLLPTRELAIQVHAVFEVYGGAVGINATCLYGQTPYPQQETALRRGVDVVIGTPGRIKDFVLKRTLDLSSLKFRVLDEADEMLRLGFVADVELILGQVKDLKQVQTLLFSATLPSCVQNIARRFLKPEKETADLVGNEKMKASANVRHMVLPCCSNARSQLIPDIIRCYSSGGRTIIFTETKNSASELAGLLPDARALHGDIQQATREVTLKGFRSGKFMTLVATNVAARGLDINDVQLVIQCEPPRDVEDYIHRSGRTGRAGNTGVAVMLYESRMRSSVSRIEKESGFKFEHVSAPQPADVAKVVGFDAAEAITKVTDSVIPIFESVAEFLLSSSGLSAKHLLSKALAKAAGYTEIKTRSLLTSMENYVTVHLEAGKRVYSPSFIFGILKRLLPEEKVELVKGVTLTADARGAVFDVPSGDLDSFLTGQKNAANVSIDVVTVLPPLQERVESRMGRYGGRYGGRFGGYGGRGAPKW